jgi:PAS domain S-box-containing protein
MKLERTVIALIAIAIIARASSVYWSYLNFSTGEASGAMARHTHRVIESVYQIEYQTAIVENSSDKYILSREPYYAVLARQNALTLNSSIQSLLDSVKDNPDETERVSGLEKLVISMEKNMPGVDSVNHDLSEMEPTGVVTDKTETAEMSINKILSKANEIINEEFRLLAERRGVALQSQQNAILYTYYAAGIGIVFVIIILLGLNRSIRRQKAAEAEARGNEVKLRGMLEEVGDVIYSSDYSGVFTYINARLGTLTGYTSDELLGKHFTFLVHPDWMERVKEFYYQQFINLVHETRFEFPILTKQGSTKWVEQNVVMVSRDNRVESFQCVVRDITQRKTTEEEIRRTNRFLDSVLENIPNMIFIKDAKDLRFLRFNKAGEQLLGYLQEDMLGKNDYDFFPKEQADFFTKKDREVLDTHTGVDILEEPIKSNHGTLWLHTKKIPVNDSDGKPIYLLGISEDITERKKNEDTIIELNKNLARYVAELEESQRFYKTIARNFPDGTITVLDRNLNYIFVDGRELAMEGLSPSELLGNPYLKRFPDEIRDYIRSNLLSIFKGNNAIFEVALSGNNYLLHGVPLESTTGNIDEILVVKQNITKLKQAEENMKAALEKEKLINELKSRFVSLASHEFRTPLSTILSSTELIGEYIEHDGKNAALIKEKNIHHLKRIKSAVHNMVNTLNSFLSLDQLEQGKTLTHPINFDITALSKDITGDLNAKLKPGQKIEYTHNSTISRVFMDRQIIKNITLNLLSNAIKYSPQNSIIKYTTEVTESGLEFTVEDRGIGIPDNEQANLFERFFRAKNTLNIEGTGLGLSIVKKYIDLLNGTISFTSRENEGSIFKVFVSNAEPVPQESLRIKDNNQIHPNKL